MKIEFQNVSKTFRDSSNGNSRGVQALAPINLSIPEGEFFSIIGPSGCGKSTLLNLLAGLEKSDTGQVLLDGIPITAPGPDRVVVFQEHGLMPWMTVSRNIEYGLKLLGLDKSERRERALYYLKMVHLSRYADAMPHTLSGGMKQRVAIARALALKPRVLLMYEPFSALDAQTRYFLHDEFQRIWHETKTTILFVTHNLPEAIYLADRVMIMTAPPGQVKKLVRVPFSHPRDKSSADLSSFTAALHLEIKSEVEKVAARELDPDWQPEIEVHAPTEIGFGI
jgi:NitT/TauT family transport system ATP-binding protein